MRAQERYPAVATTRSSSSCSGVSSTRVGIVEYERVPRAVEVTPVESVVVEEDPGEAEQQEGEAIVTS